ncbi:hypothetical protein [Devosia sp.]|uniref:hypothetical protein n=1 Tax=Devosia sp. TaxID=1871048 RepID=UPI0032655646
MKSILVAAVMLASVGSAMAADVYDAVYVSDMKLCEQAKTKGADIHQALFDLKARAVAPRLGVWMSESYCSFLNQTTGVSPMADNDPTDVDLYSTARCIGYDLDFLDQVVVSHDSMGINESNGDTVETPPAKVQIISLREGMTGYVPDTDSIAGIYTLCEAIKPKDLVYGD